MGAVSLPPGMLEEGQRTSTWRWLLAVSLGLRGAAAGPHPTPPITHCGPVSALTADASHMWFRAFLPDSSLSLVFSTSPFRKKENTKMLRAETLTGNSKAPPGGC